ncbi:MAG TPA: hypothetical protein VN258_08430 [Mobilitalea sp.]|nr:hypothetical protein [Mobilitalea sp.]
MRKRKIKSLFSAGALALSMISSLITPSHGARAVLSGEAVAKDGLDFYRCK